MEIRCPHCGKQQILSTAQLKAVDGKVVCPQCVSMFNVEIQEEPQKEILDNQVKSVSTEWAAEFSFCPHCGAKLPLSGLNFCPYCGQSLHIAEQSTPITQLTPEESAPPTPSDEPLTLGEMPLVLPFGKRLVYRDQPASTRFRLFAYSTISALLTIGIILIILIATT